MARFRPLTCTTIFRSSWLVSQTRLQRVKKVGSGGYGLVEVCMDPLTHELVAVKYMVRHTPIKWAHA